MTHSRLLSLLGALLFFGATALGNNTDVQVEFGGTWFSRNDVRIPGEGGTRFNMLDLVDNGPVAHVRLHATYALNPRHALRLTLAPLEAEGTGMLNTDVVFEDEVFAARTPVKGTYRFNTYRLTYQWTFREAGRWRLGVGAAALIRDAEVELEQNGKRQSRDDLGLVPLLHAFAACRITDQLSVVFDVEGAWAPMGRAIDATIQARYDFGSGWYALAGYRTLEGGADNDDVYTFAWLHTAVAGVGCRF